jgi:hypothetical protein
MGQEPDYPGQEGDDTHRFHDSTPQKGGDRYGRIRGQAVLAGCIFQQKHHVRI